MGLLSWRFLQEEAGYGVLSDLMSHAIDMAQFLCGPISRVVAVKETFIKQRPLPVPGAGTHYDRGKPGDPTGSVTNEDYVGALVEFESGTRGHARVRPLDRRAAELDGLRTQRLEGRRRLGSRDAQPAPPVPSRGTAQRRVHRGARRRRLPESGQHRAGRWQLDRLRGSEVDRGAGVPQSVAAGRPTNPAFPRPWPTPRSPRPWSAPGRPGRWEDVVSLRIDPRGARDAGEPDEGEAGAGEAVFGCFVRTAEP